MNGAEFEKAQAVLREYPGQYSWARCIQCNGPGTHFVQEDKNEFRLFCDRHAPGYAENLNPKDRRIISGGRDMPSHPAKLMEAFLPANLPDTVSKLSGLGASQLGKKLAPSFGIQLQSTGSKANVELTRIIFQTFFVSERNPCLVTFDQFILAPFTGPGQFDLTECDAIDVPVFDSNGKFVSGGASQVTIATKSGFADGVTTGIHSRLIKVNTVDKIYRVSFVPGTAGNGVYSITAQELRNPPVLTTLKTGNTENIL